MRRLTWQTGTAVAIVSLCIGAAGWPAMASTEDEIARLKEIILEQQRRFEEQEKRLAEQERRLMEQAERLAAQEKKLAEQERLSQSQGLILTEQRGDLEDLYARFEYLGDTEYGYGAATRGQPPFTLAQDVQPRAPTPLPPEPTTPDPAAPTPTAPQATPGEEDRPESETPTDQLLLEVGGILLPPGTLQIEPGVEYTYIDSDQVGINGVTVAEAIVIGDISVDKLERHIVRPSVSTRLGVFDRLQIDAFVPYVYRTETLTDGATTADAQDIDTTGDGIGDVQFGVAYQPLIGRNSIPDVIVRSRATFPTGEDAFDIDTKTVDGQTVLEDAPTGSGFYSLENTLTAVWTSDPVVFFAGGGYTFNFEDSKNGQDIDPGDSYQFFGGMNIALSERISLNMSFIDQITMKTDVDGSSQDGTTLNDGRVVLGMSYGISPDVSLLVGTAIGVTDESPDFQFTVSVPVTLQVF